MNSVESATMQLVTFTVAGDQYAVDIFCVERVLRFVPARAVPNAPSWLPGVIDYQGRVVPLLDLRKRFELPPAPPGSETRIVVFDLAAQWVAAVVDSVQHVTTVTRTDVEEPPAIFRGLTRDYLAGLIRRPDAVVVLLDAQRLLTTQERIVLEQATEESRV